MRGWLAGAAVLTFLLAGCGSSHKNTTTSSSPKPVSASLVADAAAKSTKPGSVEADFKIVGPSVAGSGSGVFDTGADRSGQLSMKVNLQGSQVPVDSIIAGNLLYLRSSAFQQLGLSGDKAWVKLDLGQLAKQRGIDLSSFAAASPTPASALSYLRGTSNVREVGTEKVNGVDTTHYKATVDLARAAARSTGSTRQALRRVIQANGSRKLPIEVWVDGKGFIRKLRYAQRSGGNAVRLTMNLHDYGPPVEIKPPPADSVVDLQKVLGQ